MKDQALWDRLKAFQFPPNFISKLAEAEGWDETYCIQAIAEYRRFVYLTQIAQKQATPSIPIDAVWHMHLTFTRSYWEEMAPLLSTLLHHEPCLSPAEMPRYQAQYAATRALYEIEFGHPPPEDTWSTQAESTAPTGDVNAAIVATLGVALVGAVLFIASGSRVGLILAVFGAVIAAALWVTFALRALSARRNSKPADRSAGCGLAGCGSGTNSNGGGGFWGFGGSSGKGGKGDGGADGGSDGGGGCGGGGCGGG